MQQTQQELPDAERRAALESLVNDLKRARTALPDNVDNVSAGVQERVADSREALSEQIETVRNELDDIPEWDESLVKDLTLSKVGNRDTNHHRVDNEVVVNFTVRGSLGNEVDCRYGVAVTSGNEWFHVDVDGDWEEVWSN